ncbi:hypothetical protein CBER1_06563 [Cercospora berteroae]|uniref:Apple domain-containing protein n=1 Tax=Cercospora berteroae TaxID=357750 RepID=A0A2S6C3L0_9PEZI|nr:hypothetical protein CBER1_06563 [Cercospora berteroae]
MQLLNSLLVFGALAPLALGQDVCGTTGIAIKIPYLRSKAQSLNTATACGTRCTGDSKCKSYAVGGGYCMHYSSPVRQAFVKTSKGTLKYYDRICAPVKLTPPKQRPRAATDSPPLPSSEVTFPTDAKSFIAGYTYDDDPLPSILAMGSAPLAEGLLASQTGLPELPCMMDPGSNEQFNILDSGFVPLVSRTRVGIVPFPTPTSEAEAKASGPADKLVLQPFSFSKPANAPNGVYDIVVAGSTPQYLGKKSQGALVVTGSSTGTTEQTRMGKESLPPSLDWTIVNGSPRFTAGTSNKQMVTYPLKRAAAAARARKVRRSKYTEGYAPRCPNSPPGLVAKVRPGARAAEKNGCGAANGFDFVPDFSFGTCCDDHDLCFDNCESGTYEECNANFGNCMRTRGCDYLNNWYSYPVYLSCIKAANFYEFSVNLPTGRDAFYEANTARCGCYCFGGGLCTGRSGEGYTCTSMFGSDVKNCGACGRECSAVAACKSGSCVCPKDQYKDRCLDLKTHPKNCGSCGHVCASGYCYQGQCFNPPPDKCVPPNPFRNADFEGGSDWWSYCDDRVERSVSQAKTCGEIKNTGVLLMAWQNIESAGISTTVSPCPNQVYQLNFKLKGINTNSVTCSFK